MLFKVASWNVNSLKMRLEQVINYLKQYSIDVIALQETKITDDKFPQKEINQAGFNVIFAGDKQYNGVAIISKHDIGDSCFELIGDYLKQKRYLACTINNIRFINVYVPNGSEVGSDKYKFKLDWLDILTQNVEQELKKHSDLMIMGDFNIAPTNHDVYDINEWQDSVLVSDQERRKFYKLIDLGLIDLYRYKNPQSKEYSWWDYRMNAFRRNLGLRIDHMLVNKGLMAKCSICSIDKEPRKNEKPSDHGIVTASLKI